MKDESPALVQIQLSTFQRENIMKEKIDLSLNRSLEELESSYWEFIDATEGEDSSGWSSSVQEDISALEGYLMKMEVL